MNTTRSTTHEAPMIENATFSNKVRRMLGFDLDFWNNVLVASSIFGALAAAAVGVSTYVVIRLQKAAELAAEDELERYKVDAGRKIAEADA
jgi:hypothetical protein